MIHVEKLVTISQKMLENEIRCLSRAASLRIQEIELYYVTQNRDEHHSNY